MAGLTVSEFRWRYGRAWKRFVEAIAAEAPSPRCEPTRQLLADVQSGVAPPGAESAIDAHTLDCASCRVFARESYRALEILPLAPTAGFVERWSSRLGGIWERSGPEATAGAGTAAAGAGLWALLTGGSVAGLLKTVSIVCTVTAVTAGLCAGVANVIEQASKPATPHAEKRRSARQSPTPSATPAATATPISTPRRVSTSPRPSRGHARDRLPGLPARRSIRAARARSRPPHRTAASEFAPSASGASLDPAPATDSGGGEFTP